MSAEEDIPRSGDSGLPVSSEAPAEAAEQTLPTSPSTTKEEISVGATATSTMQAVPEPDIGHGTGFKKKWLTEGKWPWLRFDAESNTMWCDKCRRHKVKIRSIQSDSIPKALRNQKGKGNFIDGCTNWRTLAMHDHEASKGHSHAVFLDGLPQVTVPTDTKKTPRHEAIVTALKTVHWLVSEEVANIKYSSLLQFMQHLDVPSAKYLNQSVSVKYTSPEIFNDLLAAMDETLKRRLISELKRSPVVGIGIDESTDRSTEKRCVWVIRYVHLTASSAKVKTAFMACREVENCTSESLLNSTRLVLNDYGVTPSKVSNNIYS